LVGCDAPYPGVKISTAQWITRRKRCGKGCEHAAWHEAAAREGGRDSCRDFQRLSTDVVRVPLLRSEEVPLVATKASRAWMAA